METTTDITRKMVVSAFKDESPHIKSRNSGIGKRVIKNMAKPNNPLKPTGPRERGGEPDKVSVKDCRVKREAASILLDFYHSVCMCACVRVCVCVCVRVCVCVCVCASKGLPL